MVSRCGNDISWFQLASSKLHGPISFFSLLKKLFVDICCGNFRSRTFGLFNITKPTNNVLQYECIAHESVTLLEQLTSTHTHNLGHTFISYNPRTGSIHTQRVVAFRRIIFVHSTLHNRVVVWQEVDHFSRLSHQLLIHIGEYVQCITILYTIWSRRWKQYVKI